MPYYNENTVYYRRLTASYDDVRTLLSWRLRSPPSFPPILLQLPWVSFDDDENDAVESMVRWICRRMLSYKCLIAFVHRSVFDFQSSLRVSFDEGNNSIADIRISTKNVDARMFEHVWTRSMPHTIQHSWILYDGTILWYRWYEDFVEELMFEQVWRGSSALFSFDVEGSWSNGPFEGNSTPLACGGNRVHSRLSTILK